MKRNKLNIILPLLLALLLIGGMFIGNQLNRVDIMNLSMGCAAAIGKTQIINGFVVPISSGEEKAFDFEYDLQIHRMF